MHGGGGEGGGSVSTAYNKAGYRRVASSRLAGVAVLCFT